MESALEEEGVALRYVVAVNVKGDGRGGLAMAMYTMDYIRWWEYIGVTLTIFPRSPSRSSRRLACSCLSSD